MFFLFSTKRNIFINNIDNNNKNNDNNVDNNTIKILIQQSGD